ncbi:MAG: L-2-amino-thiazoline-4-carboxylic acid hydrolase [Desulfobacterales bacterium]|nr:MAG: L-2-amino-thiazoline-4-carboxylic acid hydrolase [Desulfobacterales bacterium]
MQNEKKIQLLQLTYAAVLADAADQFAKENVLQNVIQRKKAEQMATGKMKAEQFGITSSQAVFTQLAEAFNCAAWQIENLGKGFVAVTSTCKLCAIAKKINAPAPCYLYCLDPMEGMVKGLNPNATFIVEETLWEGKKCRVLINKNTG